MVGIARIIELVKIAIDDTQKLNNDLRGLQHELELMRNES
jgi:hypothetical protein